MVRRNQGRYQSLPGLLFVPDAAAGETPATLYVDGRRKGREAAAEGRIDGLVNDGRIVLTIDVRGIGELADRRPFRFEDQRRTAIPSLFTGHCLIGQRTEDVQQFPLNEKMAYFRGNIDASSASISRFAAWFCPSSWLGGGRVPLEFDGRVSLQG